MVPFKDQFSERSQRIEERLQALQASLGETQAGIDTVKSSARQFQSLLAALDGAEGGYQVAADTLRNSSRQISLANHDIEVAVSRPYFEKKLELEPFAAQDVEVAEGVDFSIAPRGEPSLLLQQPIPHDTCYAMGKDDIAVRQEIQITAPFQQSYAPHVWTALGLGVQDLKLRVFPSRGARLCEVVPALDVYERVFPLRMRMMTEIHSYLGEKFGKPQDLTEFVGDFRDALDVFGIDLQLYDVHVGEQLSFYGRDKSQPLRPLERYAPLPLLDEGWDVGVKIHKSLLEPKIREMVQSQVPEAILGDVSFDADDAIRMHATKHFEASGESSGVKVTVKITASAVVKISLSSKRRNEVWAHAETESVGVSETDVDIDPDWLEKLAGPLKDRLESKLDDEASRFLPEDWPGIDRKMVTISKARRVQPSITVSGLELRIAF